MPSVTRAEGNGENGFKEDIRISAVAELDDLTSTAFSDVFLMEEKRWEGNTHSWGINTALHLIATSPTDYNGEAIPTIVKNGDKDALMAGYRYCGSKPASVAFTMSHLMGQLRVHIQVAGNADGTPTDAEITLRKCSAVNYTSSPSVSLSDETEAFPLGAFAKQENEEAGNYVNTTQTIIPQTLAKGIRCLSFKIDNTRYAFTPDKDIALAAEEDAPLSGDCLR